MYRYQMCGLDNVWLVNGYEHEETPYGPAVSIADATGLNKAIALTLCAKSSSLSGPEARFLRKHMELSQESLGTVIGISGQSIARWENEQSSMPRPFEELLRLIAVRYCNGGS